MRSLRFAVGAALLAVTAYSLPTVAVDRAPVSDWPSYGQSASELRYASLDQINPLTVGRLGLSWYHEFDTDRGQQATPIMVDGILYTSTAWSKVYAFDARTGRPLWAFDPKVPVATLPTGCCEPVNRGVSVSDGRVFVGTFDGRLVALDAKTGKQLWSVVTVDQSRPYTITGATHVVKGLVLIGNGGAEYGVRGYLSAYDAATGKLAWRFYTVPNPEGKPDGQPSDEPLARLADKTWFGTMWRKTGGGGTVWDSMAYDPAADILYFGVGNGNPHDRTIRSDGKGDNLFLSSIVAVRPSTGRYLWHYQTTPGDSWDYTATQHIMLLDMVVDGKPRKLLAQAPKNGFFYLLDRITGELLSATAYTEVNWASDVDPATGRPQEDPGAHYVDKPFLQYPGSLGAHSWHPMAFSPQTGLVYIPVQHIAQTFGRNLGFKYRPGHINSGLDIQMLAFPDDPTALAGLKADTFGELVAWDPLARKARWRVRHPYFLNGGVLATQGGLVFQGSGEGTFDAYDASTGAKLWSMPTYNGIVAPPISYALDGKQYVAVMVGYGGFGAMIGTIVPDRPRLPGRLMVFALDANAHAPTFVIPTPEPPHLEKVTSTGDPVAGLAAYNDNCLVCHGFSATSRYTADLRRSPMITSAEAFQAVVMKGALKEMGMVSFAKYLSPADAENIRAYLIREGRKIPVAQAKP